MATGDEWQVNETRFVLERERGEVTLLLPRRGWVRASRLYTLTQVVEAGPYDATRWGVLALGREALVVRERDATDDGAPHTARTIFDCWSVPVALVTEPERLRGGDEEAVRRFFLEAVVQPSAIAMCGPTREPRLPQVPVAAIESEIHRALTEAAASVAAQGNLRIDAEPMAAARQYCESEPADNMNETVFCSWRWRLGFGVQAGGVSGLLTLEASASECDACESDGIKRRHHDIGAWLAMPRGEVGVHHAVPGIALADFCGCPPGCCDQIPF